MSNELDKESFALPEDFIFVDIQSGNLSQSLWIPIDISSSKSIKLKGDDTIWYIKKVYKGTEKDINSINRRSLLIENYKYYKIHGEYKSNYVYID